MYKTEAGNVKFSFTKLMSNAVPNIAGTPHGINLTSREEDLAFLHQLNEHNPFVLSPQVFTHAGITSESKISVSIYKALLKHGVLEQEPPYMHTDKITRNFANQVPGITSHAQKKLINFLFFWEEEGQRLRKLSGELEELKVVIAEEKEGGGNVGTYETRLAEVDGEMRLVPSLRSQQVREEIQLPGYCRNRFCVLLAFYSCNSRIKTMQMLVLCQELLVMSFSLVMMWLALPECKFGS